VGSIFYDSGYGGGGGGGGDYSNPYYASVPDQDSSYNYSQPIPTDYQQQAAAQSTDPYTGAAPPAEPPEVKEGTTHGDLAREAFKQGDYPTALKEIDQAIKKLPKDAALHEFRALVYFAQQNYKQAANILYAVLSAGPGWDWTTLSSMYPSVETYTTQLRALEQYVKANPNSPEGRFVLAYEYITCGHKEQAIRELKEVIRLQPNDQLSPQLIKMLGGTVDPTSSASPPTADDNSDPTASSQPKPPDVDVTKLVGDWSATRADDGSKFTLKLTADKKFSWSYTRGDKHNSFGGTYTMDGAVLVLQRADSATMPGLVTLESDGFNFKLYGGPPNDKGLEFKK
jgi:tetratricopeptide (TPR) repeat protein